MDNIDVTENTAKVSDSAYSNSCSNSQSRRSHSSKSTRSGSNSSGSSGYGGQPSTGSSSNELNQQTKKEKDSKKKKQTQVETVADSQIEGECGPQETVTIFPIIEENEQDVYKIENLKYRVIYEYEFHRGTSAAETARNINVYGGGVAKENTVRFWFQRFRSGNFDLQNKLRGRLETKVDNEELKAIVKADPSQTTSELAAGCGVSDKTVLF